MTDRWTEVGLTHEEYRSICDVLGREPNDVELGLYGGMWSEHCSYKSSKAVLKKFPTTGARIKQGPGENAGVVEIAPGVGVAFKAESHNHPSAIEPFQGAATGVGGIIRDIFTMGARPIAMFNSLRFGPTDDPRSRHLLTKALEGSAYYANCIGTATVGGEVYFEDCYKDNPLVNVMCVGLVDPAKIKKGRADGPGNPVLIAGARTGRDGVHGASLLASQTFEERPEDQRPAVQAGNPFLEALLVEATLEALESGDVVGIQDMGAAGLISSSSETASRAGTGIEIDVALVPQREEGLTPYEIMLSESQERMLVIAQKGAEDRVRDVFKKWGLECVIVGKVTDDGMLRVLEDGEIVAEVPAKSLADDGPTYVRPYRKPDDFDQKQALDLQSVVMPEDLNPALDALLASGNIASKEWAYRQFDQTVQTNTVVPPGADAAVLRVKNTDKAIALSMDCNGRYCHLDPFTGGAIAVAEAARNVACVGARPIAITNCLNFASPERPEVMWAFRATVDGMSAACRVLDTPVTGGNVSFYNETLGSAIYPTPVVGMLGVIEDVSRVCTPGFKNAGDTIAVLGHNRAELGGSEYLKLVHGLVAGRPPALDLQLERSVIEACIRLIAAGCVRSAHDCSEGGLAVALAECCIKAEPDARGCSVDLRTSGRKDAVLFGESQSRIVVTFSPDAMQEVLEITRALKTPIQMIGIVTDERLVVRANGEEALNRDVDTLEKVWRGAFSCSLK